MDVVCAYACAAGLLVHGCIRSAAASVGCSYCVRQVNTEQGLSRSAGVAATSGVFPGQARSEAQPLISSSCSYGGSCSTWAIGGEDDGRVQTECLVCMLQKASVASPCPVHMYTMHKTHGIYWCSSALQYLEISHWPLPPPLSAGMVNFAGLDGVGTRGSHT